MPTPIKPEDLRVGNYLQDGVSKTLLKVVELTEKDITTYVIDRSMFPLKQGFFIQPIPLTEEMLLKLGFIWNDFEEENPEWLVLKRGTRNWLFSDASTNFSVVTFNHKVLDEINITSVHQLQNLYHALTGQELNLKDA